MKFQSVKIWYDIAPFIHHKWAFIKNKNYYIKVRELKNKNKLQKEIL